MAQILNSLPAGPTSEAEIASFETHIGHRLPDDYRAFLLKENGGHPEPDAFTLNIWGRAEEDIVMCFFPMQDLSICPVDVSFDELRTWPVHCAWNDLMNDLKDLYEKELDEALLPIGTDGSGNYFCIVLDGPRRGSILFLEHEMAETELLAESFESFLASLRQRERTDYAPELG
ncbi:MAG: SMI1/KNR4 family protein [Planctomycetaceae bacterium]|nr:SMI1/KNR4 family protein [Planctomycetaceae bacterium]